MHHNLEELEYIDSIDDCGIYPGTRQPTHHLSAFGGPKTKDGTTTSARCSLQDPSYPFVTSG